jgi:hypothetical protein
MPFVKAYQVTDGVMAGEQLPDEPEQLYATPAELGAAFGVRVTEAQIRHAMSLIHGYCHRQTLWPAEYVQPLTRLPNDRMETRLPVTPVIRIEDAAGRYGYNARRDRQSVNALYYGLGAIMALQGVAPRLMPINPELIQVEAATGIVSLPYGTFVLPYSECTFRYVAGYVTIPAGIKTCLAQIINNVTTKGSGDRIAYSVGRINRRYATASYITADEERLLAPYVVTGLY